MDLNGDEGGGGTNGEIPKIDTPPLQVIDIEGVEVNGNGVLSLSQQTTESESSQQSTNSSEFPEAECNSSNNMMKRKSSDHNLDCSMPMGKKLKNLNQLDVEFNRVFKEDLDNDVQPSYSEEPESIPADPEIEANIIPLNRNERIITFEDDNVIEYLQATNCKKHPCRECKVTNNSSKKRNFSCRFIYFRKFSSSKLNIHPNGKKPAPIAIGFSSGDDAKLAHEYPYLPSSFVKNRDEDIKLAKYLVYQLGDQVCDIFAQERAAELLKRDDQEQIAWKRPVHGVREMCDVCETTLFNYHWTCGSCGFVACLDCYDARKEGKKPVITKMVRDQGMEDKDDYLWMKCTNLENQAEEEAGPSRQEGEIVKVEVPSLPEHDINKMLLTKVIPRNALAKFSTILHSIRQQYGILHDCNCKDADEYPVIQTYNMQEAERSLEQPKIEAEKAPTDDETDDDEEGIGFLKSIVEVQSEVMDQEPKEEIPKEVKQEPAHHLNLNNHQKHVKYIQIEKSTNLGESTSRWEAPHRWFCFGRLLRLLDPKSPHNLEIFQEFWKRGQPIMVSDVNRELNQNLWTPKAFSRDCGHQKNELINCLNGNVVKADLMSKFWDGFTNISRRKVDKDQKAMLLKLKDWPPTEDFATELPERFADLMQALPLKEYTTRDGKLNLASQLPDNLVKPDLGPKMYIAYGSAEHLDKGTTNLHLDISDAVNLLVYVGITEDGDTEAEEHAIMEAIRDSDCDEVMIKRVSEKKELPGALWHIYRAIDADSIRDFLNRVAEEKNMNLEPGTDPIHDQCWYLDKELRQRLRKEYNISGYPIVQCMGDAVFIPAGAPHQVRNLNNCIKIAEDFVSPENAHHCVRLTGEFRKLSSTHSNKEDKLQIKNILFHAVKKSLSILNYNSPKVQYD